MKPHATLAQFAGDFEAGADVEKGTCVDPTS